MLENGEGEPEEAVPEKEVEVEAEAAEGEEGEEGAKPKVLSARSEKEEPINVKLEGDSDDEFCAIEIKEKIREFITTNGKDARIPDDLINEAVRWRLNRNDCQNRGYVLDGYPKNFQQANDVFIITPKKEEKKAPVEGEEEEAPVEEEGAVIKPVL